VNLHVHIEELVLHGFAPGDRAAIGETVQAELGRLFRESGVPPALAEGGAADRLAAGSFETGATARPESTGGQIAAAVYRGLGAWASE
jgi:hypothetical protein